MSNHYHKLFWLIPLAAIVMFFFVNGIPVGFAANQSAPIQADTAKQVPQATRTLQPTYTATLPPVGQANMGTAEPSVPKAQGTPLSLEPAPLMTLVPILGTATPIPDVSSFSNQAVFSFRDIGTTSFTLHFPEIFTFDIDLPDRWQISPSTSFIEVRYTLAEDYGYQLATRSPFGRYRYGLDRPSIEVYIDDQLAGSILPEVGEHTARVKLPYGMVETLRFDPTNSHSISFHYYRGADIYCDYSGVVTIHDISTINLNFNVFAPALTLSTFPQPLIQSSFVPEILLIVLPNEYNEKDLTNVAKISAAVGRTAASANLKIEVLKSSEVSPALLAKSSAIFLGTPNRNEYLSRLFLSDKFVTKVSSDGRTIMGIGANEGLLQLAYSDINPNNVYLAVTGNSDDGVSKAVSDLAYPPVGLSGVFFISRAGFTPKYEPTPPPDIYRISDFGYRERIVYGLGTQRRGFDFFVPRNWIIQDGAKLVVTYAHALNLSYDNSGATVFLNDTPIGSLPMDANDYGEIQFEFPIKKENIIPGTLNSIRFQVTLERSLDCTLYEARVTWFNIRDTSLLYLPYKLITEPKDLPIIHDPVFYLANEPRFLVVLPEKPSNQEMSGMASFVRAIGSQLRYPFFDIKVSMDPKLDPKTYMDYNFIAIGRPTRNPFIQSINNDLPQPFVPAQDTLTLQQKIGDYRIEQSIGIGMVQAMESPWNKMRGVTVITATNDEGLKWALDRVTNSNTIYDFTGELTFVETDKVQSFEMGVPLHVSLASVMSGLTGKPVSLEPVQPSSAADQGNGPAPAPGDKYVPTKTTVAPQIGIVAIIGLVAIGLVIAVIGITRTIRGGRKR